MKILTKLICLSIVAVSLLTGCETLTEKEEKTPEIENKTEEKIPEMENKTEEETPEIENNIECFNGYSEKIGANAIIKSSTELQDCLNYAPENSDFINQLIAKYDDDFFTENALVAISLFTSTPGYEVTVTSFETENEKAEVAVELKKYVRPDTSSIMVIIDMYLSIKQISGRRTNE
jgi:hypothetical protein